MCIACVIATCTRSVFNTLFLRVNSQLSGTAITDLAKCLWAKRPTIRIRTPGKPSKDDRHILHLSIYLSVYPSIHNSSL